ncbi:hypothetical protein FZC76_02155 [Sutcliffiella horikoshii]|uniref:Uncharacterized protein n=1 Tax=Sutcliffiella horikoshii TaxID=79883 RepID=A0A5D4T638_9BACI|nr:hypothetical protein FZC76_02155 [Sutcliffiella horikoshii]
MRPLKRCEEAQALPLGKRSHLRKSTAALNQAPKLFYSQPNTIITKIPTTEHLFLRNIEAVPINK